jgi:hypothetical protein
MCVAQGAPQFPKVVKDCLFFSECFLASLSGCLVEPRSLGKPKGGATHPVFDSMAAVMAPRARMLSYPHAGASGARQTRSTAGGAGPASGRRGLRTPTSLANTPSIPVRTKCNGQGASEEIRQLHARAPYVYKVRHCPLSLESTTEIHSRESCNLNHKP